MAEKTVWNLFMTDQLTAGYILDYSETLASFEYRGSSVYLSLLL